MSVLQWASALLVGFISTVLLSRYTSGKRDPREPLVLHPKVPFIGHVIGLITQGASYFSRVSAKCPSIPIFSLPMLTSRTYVVTQPALAGQIQRSSATLQFTPLILEVTKRMVGLSNVSMERFSDLNAPKENRPSFMDNMHEMLYFRLSPPEIKTMSTIVLSKLTQKVNAVPNALETDLFAWIRSVFSAATTFALYGPENPFVKHPELIGDFWGWEQDMIHVMARPFPQFTARKAWLRREKMCRALLEYMENKSYEKADKLVQERWRLHTELDISMEDKARSELGMLFGALVNAGVTAFWVLNNIYSRTSLLSALRDEISQHALTTTTESNGQRKSTISFKALQATCPLLNSVYRETLRLTAPMSSSRVVTADTLVQDKYLLRANSVVQIAGGVIHHDPSVWGPDAHMFNPRRFLTSMYGTKTDDAPSPSASEQEKEKSTNVHPAAYRAFGGGSVFCPGRFFAQIEILSLVAGVIMGFEFDAPTGRSEIKFDPPMDEKRIPLGVMKPLAPVVVSMKRRNGLEDVEWELAP